MCARFSDLSMCLSIGAAVLLLSSGAGGAQDAKPQDATALPPITVETQTPKPRPTAPPAAVDPQAVNAAQATEPTPNAKGDVGYLATRGTSGTKTDTPLRNVPQSISVITEQQIKDQAFQSIGDVTRYVPGVILHQGEGNRDQISIRGQVASTADFFRDGVRDDAQIFRDLYNAQRVEFLKGPAALAFGRGGAGGVVNIVSKEPVFGASFGSATMELGSFAHKRITLDSGAMAGSAAAFRMNAMFEDSGSYRDYNELKRWAINPTFSFKPADGTKVTVGYEHAYDHRTADRGIPSFMGMPSPADRSTFFGNADLNYAQTTVDRVYAIVEHNFGGGLSVRNHASYVHYDKFYQNIYPGTPLGGTLAAPLPSDQVGLLAYNNANQRDNLFNQTDFTYKFGLGITKHTLLFGAEIGHQISNNERRNGAFDPATNGCLGFATANNSAYGQCNVLFSSPTLFGNTTSFNSIGTKNHVELDVRSVYLQDQIQITKYFELLAGLRYDNFNQRYVSYTSSDNLTLNNDLFSPRLGLILKPTDTLSLYASYGVTYLPASGDQFASVTSSTVSLDPEKYTNYEIGSKWDITKSLAFTTALFKTDRVNVRFPIDNSGHFVESGTSQVQGFEAQTIGYLTNRWLLSAGWSHIFTGSITSDTGTSFTAKIPAGTRLPLLPQDTLSLWNKYQFTDLFAAGVGVVYHANSIAALQPAAAQVVLPAYTTVDAALFFKFSEKLSGQINATNIFNRNYIASADSNDNLTPAPPTTVIVSMTAKF
jgi:catecholate siderophore receptor